MSNPKVFALALTLLTVACGGGDGTAAGPGGGFDIDEESLSGSGGLTLTGTITLSTSVGAGTGAHVGLISGTSVPSAAWFGNEFFTGWMAQGGSSLRFRITNLDAEELRVFALVDTNGDSFLTSGDLGGYHGGTAASPVQDPPAALAIQLDRSFDLVFGIGPIP